MVHRIRLTILGARGTLLKFVLRQARRFTFSAAAAAIVITSSCGSEKLLSVQFNDEPVDSIPKTDQEVGKCRVGDPIGQFGQVRIKHLPLSGNGNWIQLTQQAGAPPAKFRCTFIASRGDGRYLVTFRLFIPSGNAALILFQSGTFQPPTEFFTLDLPASGILSAPGSSSIAGRFPHDAIFSVAVNLEIGEASKVEVTLLGNAHGSFTADVASSVKDVARTFSVIQLTTDTKTPGSTFFANDLSALFTPPSTRR